MQISVGDDTGTTPLSDIQATGILMHLTNLEEKLPFI
jgi:hypothetical protein